MTLSGTATVAQVLGANAPLVGNLTGGFAISDSAANVAGNLDALQAQGATVASIALTDTSPVLSITVTQLLSDAATLLKVGGSYGITVSGTATVAQVLAANTTLVANLTAGFAVSDASSNVAGQSGCAGGGGRVDRLDRADRRFTGADYDRGAVDRRSAVLLKITSGYGITVSGTATVAQVLAANATLVGKLTAGFAVSDVSSNVSGHLDALEGDNGSIASIALTDGSPVLTLTATHDRRCGGAAEDRRQLRAYGVRFGECGAVLGANAALIGKLTAGIAMSDTSANVAAHLDALEGDSGSIASIALTDNAPELTVTATQLIADATVLLSITSSYGLTVPVPRPWRRCSRRPRPWLPV